MIFVKIIIISDEKIVKSWKKHHLDPGLGDDDVILDADAAEAAVLVDLLLHQELAQLGVLGMG